MVLCPIWYDDSKRDVELNILHKGMDLGMELGLRVNAGHGINYDNVKGAKSLESIYEFNIGHSINLAFNKNWY